MPSSVSINDMNNDNQPDIIVGHLKDVGILYSDCP